jgi:cobalt-zinc-cadmium efflux system protein
MEPEPVGGVTIMVVAAIGIAINGATALLFMAGRKGDLNIRGAFLHMAADALVALGVVVAGGLILLTGWLWLDPFISLVVSAVIVAGTWSLLRESVHLSLDAVPPGIDWAKVERYLNDLPGIVEVHDLHIWGLSTTESALTVHLVCAEHINETLLPQVCIEVKRRFGIGHATIQLETPRTGPPLWIETRSRRLSRAATAALCVHCTEVSDVGKATSRAPASVAMATAPMLIHHDAPISTGYMGRNTQRKKISAERST